MRLILQYFTISLMTVLAAYVIVFHGFKAVVKQSLTQSQFERPASGGTRKLPALLGTGL